MSKVDPIVFHRRLRNLLDLWKNASGVDANTRRFLNTGGLLFVAGDKQNRYKDTSALHRYLLGLDLPSTLIFITPEEVTFLCSAYQAIVLKPLQKPNNDFGAAITVNILVRSNHPSPTTKAVNKLLLAMENTVQDGKRLGSCLEDIFRRDYGDDWNVFLKRTQEVSSIKQTIDISSGLSVLMATKDMIEMQNTEVASKMTQKLMGVLFQEAKNSIHTGNKSTFKQLSDIIKAKLKDSDMWQGVNFVPGFDSSQARWCRYPIIQSGGAYDLCTLAQSMMMDDRLPDTGIILASLGIRYKLYRTNVSRSIMIDPHPTQQENYNYLVALQKFALQELKEGVIAKNFYQTIVSKVSSDRPDLELSLPESFGSGIGIAFQDPFLHLSPSCSRALKCDMIFSLEMSFYGIQDPIDSSKAYSLQLIDTVAVKQESSITLSGGLKESADVTFFFKNQQQPGPSHSHAPPREGSARVVYTCETSQSKDSKKYNEATVAKNIHNSGVSEQQQLEGSKNGSRGIEKDTSFKRVEQFAIPPSASAVHSRDISSHESAPLQEQPANTLDLESSTSLTGQQLPLGSKALKHALYSDHTSSLDQVKKLKPTAISDANDETSLTGQQLPLGSKALKRALYSDHTSSLDEVKKLKAAAISDANDETIMAKSLDGLDEESKRWYVYKKKQILKKLEQEIMEGTGEQKALNTS